MPKPTKIPTSPNSNTPIPDVKIDKTDKVIATKNAAITTPGLGYAPNETNTKYSEAMSIIRLKKHQKNEY